MRTLIRSLEFSVRAVVAVTAIVLVSCEAPKDNTTPADMAMAPREDLRKPADLAGTCNSDTDCTGGTSCCNHRCVDYKTDPMNCGRCANPCQGTCCAGTCADTMNDPAHCGNCDTKCQVAHATASCLKGACAIASCEAGWSDCAGGPGDGCEIESSKDARNCGTCGTVCSFPNSGVDCRAGMCVSTACTVGFAECNGNRADGCEINTQSDPMNCGTCGVTCLSRPNAQVKCAAGDCAIQSCMGNYLDCNKNAGDGCEVDSAIDLRNCGVCANACPQGSVCAAGKCGCPPCNFPNARMTSCQNLKCQIDACVNGYADCDKQLINGCESVSATDPQNCGGCGVVCAAPKAACIAGVCTKISTSCAAILADNPMAASGPYFIDPDGIGAVQPTQVYCDMVTAGGGWTIVYASQALDGDVGMVADLPVSGNALLYEAHNQRQVMKMALSTISKESLFKRKSDNAFIRVNGPLFDNQLSVPNSHVHNIVTLTTSNNVTAMAGMGYSTTNTLGGGDFGIGVMPDGLVGNLQYVSGFDHHCCGTMVAPACTSYCHLNSGCVRMYLYSYSNSVADGDQCYNINTGLGSWTATASCTSCEGGGLIFYAAMR